MAILGIAATHVSCNECLTLTPIEDGQTAADTVCDTCEDRGADPTCVTAVAVMPCPSADGTCTDPNHVGRLRSHVIEVD